MKLEFAAPYGGKPVGFPGEFAGASLKHQCVLAAPRQRVNGSPVNLPGLH